ncbi:hypothetical protein IAU60_001564 [Kwoniella sp. DSM 27419]
MAEAQVEPIDQAAGWPSAPAYEFSSPESIYRINAKDLRSDVRDNFWRSARWCQDGSAILSTTEDRVLRVHSIAAVKLDGTDDPLPARSTPQPDAIHSTLWYPSASTHTPETFCFVASIRDTPVRLIDANDGRIRATYPIVDHRERYIAPHSLTFNPAADRLYCGFENAIEVFDIANPGHDTSERLKTIQSKRERGGQKGIISALSFCTDYSGTFAAGSFAGSVVLYSEDTGARALAHVEGVKGGGVTQIAFHPLVPTTMYVASRRSSSIQIYDTRDLSAPVEQIDRPASTNQRISFDVDPWGRWLASGDEKLHDDAVGSVQFHAYQPLLLTASGSRTQAQSLSGADDSESSSDDDGSSDESVIEADTDPTIHAIQSHSPSAGRQQSAAVASLRIWSMTPKATANNSA